MGDSIAFDELIDQEGRDVTYRTFPNATTDQVNRTRTKGAPLDNTIKAIVRDKITERVSGTLNYVNTRNLLMKGSDGPPDNDAQFVIDGVVEDIKDFQKLQNGNIVLAYRVELE